LNQRELKTRNMSANQSYLLLSFNLLVLFFFNKRKRRYIQWKLVYWRQQFIDLCFEFKEKLF